MSNGKKTRVSDFWWKAERRLILNSSSLKSCSTNHERHHWLSLWLACQIWLLIYQSVDRSVFCNFCKDFNVNLTTKWNIHGFSRKITNISGFRDCLYNYMRFCMLSRSHQFKKCMNAKTLNMLWRVLEKHCFNICLKNLAEQVSFIISNLMSMHIK